MNRRSFGLIVRLLAVAAAIYAFYSLRQIPLPGASKTGPIPVQVIPANRPICGWIVAEKVPGGAADSSSDPLIAQAIASPGKEVAVRGQKECERMASLNGKVFGQFKIRFRSL